MRAGARELPRGPGGGDMPLIEVIHRTNRKAAIREIVFA